ncbi:MAG: hypothetical protein WDM76_11045 [Limisphaerales bacterium]
MLKRNPNDTEKALLKTTGQFAFNKENRFGLTDLSNELKEQIRQRLAEKRVVQHIPADMTGLRVEENTRGIVGIKDGRATLRQRKRNAEGKLEIKETEEVIGKLVGVHPPNGQGKLKPMRGARVITDNYGVAILDHAAEDEEKFVIIPWHKVWHRIQELKKKNAGKPPRVLRIGTLIKVSTPKNQDYKGVWMVRGVQLNQKAAGYLVDISHPDVIEYRVPKRKDCKQNVGLKALIAGSLEILKTPLTGIASKPSPPEAAT